MRLQLKNILQRLYPYRYIIIIICIFLIIELFWITISPIHYPNSTPDSVLRIGDIQKYATGQFHLMEGEPAPLYYFITGNIEKLLIHTRESSQFKFFEIISAIFSSVTVLYTYKLFKLLYNKEEIVAITGTSLLALFPMFQYIGMSIDLDALLIAAYTGFIYYSVKLLKNKTNIVDIIMLTLFLVIGLLTKQNMYLNIPIYIVILIYILYKSNLLKKYYKYLLGIIVLLTIVLLFGHTGLYNTVIPRFESLFKNNNNYTLLDYTVYNINSYLGVNGLIFRSFWGNYGYLIISLKPTTTFLIIKIFMWIIFIGLSINIFDKIKNRKINIIHIYIIVQIVVTFIFLYLLDYSSIKNYGGYFTQGRYFFPIISLIILSFIVGLRTLISPKYHRHLYLFMIICMALFTIMSINTIYLSQI